MRRTVDEKAVISAVFKERPNELIGKLESIQASVFERNDGESLMLLILCEPTIVDIVIETIAPLQDKTWDPFFVEIRDMFANTPGPKGASA